MQNEIELRSLELYTATADIMEVRATPAEGSKPATLVGYAAVFNSLSADLGGGFRERVLPGAFKESLASGRNIRALVDHDKTRLLGTSANGTARLSEDATGLRAEVDLPDTQAARDILALVKRGDVRGMSFGFMVPPNGDRIVNENGTFIRELVNVRLNEISVLAMQPAYPATSVEVRAEIAERIKSQQTRPELSKRQMQYRQQLARG